MKKILSLIALQTAILLTGYSQVEELSTASKAPTNGSDSSPNRIVIPFSNDGERFVEAHLMRGSISVFGYDGETVIIEADEASLVGADNVDEDGMKLIGMPSTGLFAEEENNRIKVGTNNMNDDVQLTIRVPFNTNLKLHCMNKGDIQVSEISGELDMNNLNGNISAKGVSGAILAHALNGNITISLSSTPKNKPMSFTSLNGDIDLSMPSNAACDLRMQTFRGDIRSNFDIDLAPANSKPVSSSSTGSRKRMEFETVIKGKINGGGPQYVISTHNGDVRIRKTETKQTTDSDPKKEK